MKQVLGPMLEDWYKEFIPANITLFDVRKGVRKQEISLVAAKVKKVEQIGKHHATGEEKAFVHTVIERYLAAGKAALEYEGTDGVVVFSPLRDGIVAHYDAAQYMISEFLGRMSSKFRIVKPVVGIRVPEKTTQVEERAMVDLGMQAGARKVWLYHESFSLLTSALSRNKEFRNGYILHIEPQC